MFGKKGTYGYLKKQPVRMGLFALLMVFVSAAIFVVGIIIYGSYKNFLTIPAVLGLLPAAKLIVSFIMYMKAEKYTCPKEIYDCVEGVFEGKDVPRLYDLYLTSYKFNFPVPSCFFDEDSLILYLSSSQNLTKECKKHLEEYMSVNSIKGYKVYIFDNSEKYLERVKRTSDSDNSEKSCDDLFGLLKNLSL